MGKKRGIACLKLFKSLTGYFQFEVLASCGEHLGLISLNHFYMNERFFTGTSLPKHNVFIKAGNVFLQAGKRFLKLFYKRNTYVEIVCALLIILFIYTGINKIMDIEKFKYEMVRSPFIENISNFIAYTLPPGEILLSFLLVIRRTRLLGLYLSYTLMALFTGYVWLMLNYAWDLPCSCGGIISKLSWNQHLIFNAALSALTLLIILLQSNINSRQKF